VPKCATLAAKDLRRKTSENRARRGIRSRATRQPEMRLNHLLTYGLCPVHSHRSLQAEPGIYCQ
jgi:hypothetical protein